MMAKTKQPKQPEYTKAEADTIAAMRKAGWSDESIAALMQRPPKVRNGKCRQSEYNGPEAYKYITLLERGLSAQRAQQYLGRDYATIKNWTEANSAFSEAIARAGPKREAFHLGVIDKAASAGEFRASAWALAVMDRETYSEKYHLQHSGEVKLLPGKETFAAWVQDKLKEADAKAGNGVHKDEEGEKPAPDDKVDPSPEKATE